MRNGVQDDGRPDERGGHSLPGESLIPYGALLAAIVESSDDAIISKTLDGQILSWNRGAERLFGYSAAEAIGCPITLIIPADRQHEEQLILERLHRGERIDHYETVRVAKGGRRLDISLTISPIRDSAGRIVAASKVARDITSRKQIEEALREADQRKDEFLATLAHELRNPLAPIRNSLEVLRLTGKLRADAEEMREILERQVEQLVRLVDDLLDVSRITRGKVELRKVPVELANVVQSAIETSRPTIESARHQLVVDLSGAPIVVEADPVRLAQVVTNLLNNAAKFTPEGGRITISACRDGDEAAISVSDTGVGISAEMLPKVFGMFYQGGSSASTPKGGLGIGLALARSFVELHGGRIEAHSEGPGKGSRFVVRLPVARRAGGNGVSAVRETAQRPRLPVHRVLVVDDAQAAVYMLGKLLGVLGQDVRTTQKAASALEMIRSDPPDLVISDIGMPEMDGYELARRMRQIPGASGMVLVALTGYGQERDRERAREAGFDYHLVKPVSLEALENLLAAVPARPSPLAAAR
jgi:PAS domain S-box-containing protein